MVSTCHHVEGFVEHRGFHQVVQEAESVPAAWASSPSPVFLKSNPDPHPWISVAYFQGKSVIPRLSSLETPSQIHSEVHFSILGASQSSHMIIDHCYPSLTTLPAETQHTNTSLSFITLHHGPLKTHNYFILQNRFSPSPEAPSLSTQFQHCSRVQVQNFFSIMKSTFSCEPPQNNSTEEIAYSKREDGEIEKKGQTRARLKPYREK